MARFRRVVLWAGLVLIVLLTVLSVRSAFIGAERSQGFFNSIPLAVYWVAFTSLLIVALIVFRRLHKLPALLLMHLGVILVLVGSMWSSESGHTIQRALFGIDKFTRGAVKVYEGTSENAVALADDTTRELPFSIRLRDFRMDYYERGFLFVESPEGGRWRFPLKVGVDCPLDGELGSVKIVKSYRNFRIDTEGEERKPFDDPSPGNNPALEVEITQPDGTRTIHYVFERFLSHEHPGKEHKLKLTYLRIVKDYIADIEVLEDNFAVVGKTVEVNHPLRHGGYYFYLNSCGSEGGIHAIFSVVSDTGIRIVFAGYLLLLAGMIWHFWLKPVLSRIEIRIDKEDNNAA